MAKQTDKTGIEEQLVRKLAELLNETGLSEIEYGKDDWHIRVAKFAGPQTVAAAPAPQTPAAATAPVAGDTEDLSNHPGAVVAPMVGVIYTSADPDSPNFVTVGDSVNAGDTLLLIEAMKVFNPIKAPKAGKVARILVNSGEPVEFGEPLVIIE